MAPDPFSSKKRRKLLCNSSSPSSSSLFDQVPTDVLLSNIFARFSNFDDLFKAKAVCSSWYLLVEEFISKMPWLMLPSKEQVEGGDGTDVNNNAYNAFLSLRECQVHSLNKVPKEFRESCCIGSSNGWLLFLEEKAIPFLFNPFTQLKIQLPSINHILGLSKMERNMDGEFELEYFDWHYLFQFEGCNKQEVRCYFVQKAILRGQPNCKNEKFGVILLCNEGGEIAYYESGDSLWTKLAESHLSFEDIVCHENYLYAVNEKSHITVWDLQTGHVIHKFDPPFPWKSLAMANALGHLCTSRLYLIKSFGDILLVLRYSGDYVNDSSTHPRVYPYRTFLFHVYKLDKEKNQWEEMESLGDRCLFLGGNQSVSMSAKSFPNCEKNSIYFTDDCWERMEEDYLYGGHDMGIYSLENGEVNPIYEYSTDSDQIQPPPCWIIPQAMLEA